LVTPDTAGNRSEALFTSSEVPTVIYLPAGITCAHHHADCLTLNTVISEYLRTQWRHDFQTELTDAVAAYPGNDTSGGDFESRFKPKDSDRTTLSCKL
jgi:hypothetical protein